MCLDLALDWNQYIEGNVDTYAMITAKIYEYKKKVCGKGATSVTQSLVLVFVAIFVGTNTV